MKREDPGSKGSLHGEKTKKPGGSSKEHDGTDNTLKENKDLFRKIFENSPLGFALVTSDFRFFSVNPAWVSMTGYAEEELLRMSVQDITPPDHLADDVKYILDLLAGTIPVYSTEKSFFRKDGSVLRGSLMVTAISKSDGTPRFLAFQIEDISERKQVEETLRESEDKFRNVFDWANDAIMLHTLTTENSPGRFIDVNRVACRMLGYTRDELLTRGPPDIVPAEFHPLLREIIRQAGTRESVQFETRFQRKDGSTFPVESSGHLIPYRGELIWISHIRDITRRKEVEEQREHLISELAKKNTELDRFTYTVSHDLKSPLIAIRAFLSLLEQDLKSGTAEQVKTDITRISESAEKLESLINTLLALSRSGKSVDTQVLIPFSDLAHDAVRLLESSWHNRMITVLIPERMPVVSGDQQRLIQVMTNLIDNAVKFIGDQQEPCIKIGVQDDAGTPVFFVKDNGIGIKKENLSKIFGLFERFNPNIPGTGIGLATVKRIIEAHGGKIWAESEGVGKGTTICFTLPVKR